MSAVLNACRMSNPNASLTAAVDNVEHGAFEGNPAAGAVGRRQPSDKTCGFCSIGGHVGKTSKSRLKNPKNLAIAAEKAAALEAAAVGK